MFWSEIKKRHKLRLKHDMNINVCPLNYRQKHKHVLFLLAASE